MLPSLNIDRAAYEPETFNDAISTRYPCLCFLRLLSEPAMNVLTFLGTEIPVYKQIH